MKRAILLITVIFSSYCFGQSYKIVDTGVSEFYSNISIISYPDVGESYYGQDAHYHGNQPSYTDNGNGTITDNVTGLIWQQDMGKKISYPDAFYKANTMILGGHTDWRVPTIKELYSLILFTGSVKGAVAIEFFIDTDYFVQPLGDVTIGEREIDAQTWSSTQYNGLTMRGDTTVFGVNFIDGRIKGYPKNKPFDASIPNTMYFRMVRGNFNYGLNDFEDNGDGTVSDNATGLMWQQADNGELYDWEGALEYSEKLELAEYSDWRLPNAKELQSLLDYSRSPQATNSPAIDPVFFVSEINDPEGNPGHYPYFWTSTSHLDGANPYSAAAYIAFGEALGKMNGTLMDVHGAGAQRSDPKSGNINNYPQYFGPQGDLRYVFNAVRCVRDINSSTSAEVLPYENGLKCKIYPNPFSDSVIIKIENQTENVRCEIFDTSGKKVYMSQYQGNGIVSMELSDLESGIYYINISAGEEKYMRTLVKN